MPRPTHEPEVADPAQALVLEAKSRDAIVSQGSVQHSKALQGASGEAVRFPTDRLGSVVTYGLPMLGCGFMFQLIGLYLMKFATDVLLVAPAVMSTLFGLARVWDGISDPLIGFMSDRTRRASGRRRPWMMASALPIGVVFVMLWSPPTALGGVALDAWMGLSIFGFFTAMTVLIVPHLALGAELTTNYHERNRVYGARHIAWTAGGIVALGALWLLDDSARGAAPEARRLAFTVALSASVVTIALILHAARRLPEPRSETAGPSDGIFSAFSEIWSNRHARLLIGVLLVQTLGGATLAGLTPYVVQYVVGGGPAVTPLVVVAFSIPSIVAVPLFVTLARRLGKQRLWLAGMVGTALSFGAMFFLSDGAVVLLLVLAFAAGTADAAGSVMSMSILADVIDFDEYQTGDRKEGAYFSTWTFVAKISMGIPLIALGYALQFFGYVPNEEQTESTKTAILVLYSLLPLVAYSCAALLLSRFSLDESAYARIREALDARSDSAPGGSDGRTA